MAPWGGGKGGGEGVKARGGGRGQTISMCTVITTDLLFKCFDHVISCHEDHSVHHAAHRSTSSSAGGCMHGLHFTAVHACVQ